jgi:hypothetical protein
MKAEKMIEAFAWVLLMVLAVFLPVLCSFASDTSQGSKTQEITQYPDGSVMLSAEAAQAIARELVETRKLASELGQQRDQAMRHIIQMQEAARRANEKCS